MKRIKKNMPSTKEARKRLKNEVKTIHYALSDELKSLGAGKTYCVLTYGCQGNEADSEVISGMLAEMGYEKVTDYAIADVVIINTCAIRENAENRIWGVLGHLKSAKANRKNMILGICGCMPQEENVANKLVASYPFIDIVFGIHNMEKLPYLLKEKYGTEKSIIDVLSIEGNILENTPKARESTHKAWVNIMYGCDEFCTYCIVPYTRGRERSRDAKDIIAEVEGLKKEGYKEVTLLGQNVNAYGGDLNNGYTFGDLLIDLSKTGIDRIRFTTSHPRDLDDKTIKAMAEHKNIMPQIHLPVQSGSNEILDKMNRKYTKEHYLDLVRKLKENIPGISITTDIIVGFPNETEEEFLETIDLVEKAHFEGAFTFIYSRRDGTPAAKIIDDVSFEEKHRRLDVLNEVINRLYLEGHTRFVGQKVKILVDGFSKTNGLLCGYSEHLKLTHFAGDESLIGHIVTVKVTEAKTWFMLGELVNE